MDPRTSSTIGVAYHTRQHQPVPALVPPSHPPAAHPGELFQFHPRASNPELWRTTVPLVVRLKCDRHKGLVSTWTAIYWLIVLHAASGRCAFGMREIAEEAGVGRNELAGPRGHIQRLVELGLLSIVGYEPVPGVKQPRPIYHVDLAELERQSLDLVPALLCERHLPPPPRPAPDPRQLALFGADEPAAGAAITVPARGSHHAVHRNGTEGDQLTEASPALGQATHGNGTDVVVPAEMITHGNGTGAPAYRSHPRLLQPARHESEPGTHENGTVGASDQQVPSLSRAGSHETGTGMHPIEPDLARNRDVDGSKERKEGGREIAHAHDFQQIVAAAAQATLLVLQQQGLVPVAPASTSAAFAGMDAIPVAPTGQSPLRASVVELWRGDRQQVSLREATQLAHIADSYNEATGGFGAYWLGRAILLADMCLNERGRPLNLPYVRSMLRRWAEEGSWGSDLPCEDAGGSPRRSRLRLPHIRAPQAVVRPAPTTSKATAAGVQISTPANDLPVAGDTEHPAIVAYCAAFGCEPNHVQAQEIVRTVTDLAAWQQVLHTWLLNKWDTQSVGNMLDRYDKQPSTAASAASEPPVSVTMIHRYPGLSDQQRDRWISRFHAAATPAEKRAVLARLEQEHAR